MLNHAIADRRMFLQGAGSALAASWVASAAAEDSDETVTVGVVGTGGRGCDLIRALSTIDGVRIVAVCDPYGPHLERGWQLAGPQARTFADYRQLLEQAQPQAVVIATPLSLHFELATAAVKAGCAVFCEKTLCYDLEQARQLTELVEANETVFQVGLQRRANAVYQQAVAMVQTGLLGRITAIESQWHRHNDWRRPVPVARDQADFAALDRQLNWRLYRDSSRGLLAELASHQLDVFQWMLGTPPRRVLASGGIDYWRDGREVADNVFCIFEYELTPPAARPGTRPEPAAVNREPYRIRATWSSLQNNAFEGASELILGTHGSLFLSQKTGLLYREAAADDVAWSKAADNNAAIVTSGKTLKLSSDPWAHRGHPIEIQASGDDTRDELVSFVDHVRSKDPGTLCTVRDGLQNTATVLMAHAALETGLPQEWPLPARPPA